MIIYVISYEMQDEPNNKLVLYWSYKWNLYMKFSHNFLSFFLDTNIKNSG